MNGQQFVDSTRRSDTDTRSTTSAVNGRSDVASPSIGSIRHVSKLTEQIGQLYLNQELSDVQLVVDSTTFHAHKIILAVRSEHFRSILYDNTTETSQGRIKFGGTTVLAFKTLLQYIYTGQMTLTELKESVVVDVLGLAHKCGFVELEAAMSEYLKAILKASNLCIIYGASHWYGLNSLAKHCLRFADIHATDVLNSDAFLDLTSAAVSEMLSRDSLCASEIDIFIAVRNWVQIQMADTNECQMLMAHVRFPLMELEELLNIVRLSKLIEADRLLDAIKEQSERRNMDLPNRRCLMPDVTTAQGAQIVDGELNQVGCPVPPAVQQMHAHTQTLLNGDTNQPSTSQQPQMYMSRSPTHRVRRRSSASPGRTGRNKCTSKRSPLTRESRSRSRSPPA